VDDFHRELGLLLWDHCGMARNASGLTQAGERVREIRDEFWQNVTVSGSTGELNQALERAGRVADFMEFAETMIQDALSRDESCGGHFREEHQTEEGEARRDDENFAHVAAWEFAGVGQESVLHKETLEFQNVALTQRSYK
jgi:succinate dehydrogenase / fumarate reductase flavoprotein subunit